MPTADDTDYYAGLAEGTVSASDVDRAPAPVDPAVDPEASAGEQVAEPIPASDVKTSANPVQPSPASGQIAYDEEGNLLPGYTLDEGNNAVFVGGGFVEPATQALANAGREAAVTSGVVQAQNQETNINLSQQMPRNIDWRVTLRLAPGATYLYNAPDAGLLQPLKVTNGIVFPYTPAITTAYKANYSAYDLTHSNYRGYFYQNSYADQVNLTAAFTAQSTSDAAYVLAVIHFFRSVTKMFYGQDQNPKIGTPPPLCYLSGLGAFQFDAHPLAITSFNYTLPTDVDYIRAGSTPTPAGVNRSASNVPLNSGSVSNDRVTSQGLTQAAGKQTPQFSPNGGTRDVTYVPTKMQISISAVPIVTRNDISNKFSLTEYATGKLLRGTQRQGGGIW